MPATLDQHRDDSYGACVICREYVPHTEDDFVTVAWPCAVVRLAAERARIRAAVEGLFDSPALYPSFWGDTIRKENEVVRAVLRIIDGEDA